MLDTSSALDVAIRKRIDDSIAVKQSLIGQTSIIGSVARELINAYMAGGKLVIFGNGGSAADAQHIAAEFVGRYYMDRRPLPALALTENISSLTGIGNDYAFQDLFSRQVEALGETGDIAVGLTTSGNSMNVVAGLAAAKRAGMVTVALTGASGGLIASTPGIDFCLCVPSSDTPRIQETHTFICHLWAEFVETAVFGGGV
ncbi:MAG: D-sedoheptulose-7-phosphate isomerase [Chloroflexota bacterium]